MVGGHRKWAGPVEGRGGRRAITMSPVAVRVVDRSLQVSKPPWHQTPAHRLPVSVVRVRLSPLLPLLLLLLLLLLPPLVPLNSLTAHQRVCKVYTVVLFLCWFNEVEWETFRD